MLDLVYIAVGIGFLLAAGAYVRFCERVITRRDDDR